MSNFILFLIILFLAIALGIAYNKLVIKEFSGGKRKTASVFTFLFFIFFAISLFVTISIKKYVNSTINSYSAKMENYVKDNYPDNLFVKNGIDFDLINDNISQIDGIVSEFKSLLPSHNDIGVNKKIYDFIVDYAMNEMQGLLATGLQSAQNAVNSSANIVNPFIDGNNVLTISSITSGLSATAMKHINVISLRTIILLGIPSLVFIVFTLIFSIRIKIKNRK
uniref:Uncharacterized protein n=1 Tax=uncultured bacterium contig00032 TaxID=1181521 RepID=A0A806KFA8_9BACT|nr:hypothetical protein [uncultured bacterium contig00032]